MGICVAYLGKLRDPGLVPAVIRDLEARARAAGWAYKRMDTLLLEGRVICTGLEGISLYLHAECEPLRFHFDPQGTLINHLYYGPRVAPLDARGASHVAQGRGYNWTKTQLAGARTHIAVCELLHHVQQHYAPDLEVIDDSGYFDDGDAHKLEQQLAYVDQLVALTRRAAAPSVTKGPLTLGAFLQRLDAELVAAHRKRP